MRRTTRRLFYVVAVQAAVFAAWLAAGPGAALAECEWTC